MKLYHGSKENVEKLEKRQAGACDNVETPEDERQEAIYLTPSYEFAVAMAARPEGQTNIDRNSKEVIFEKPEQFDPEREVYVYTVEISEEYLKEVRDEQGEVDPLQYAALVPEIIPKSREKLRALKALLDNGYKLMNWKEKPKEVSLQFKIK